MTASFYMRYETMRYEDKHSYFKALAHTLENYTNLPYSLAMRHQYYVCYIENLKKKKMEITTRPATVHCFINFARINHTITLQLIHCPQKMPSTSMPSAQPFTSKIFPINVTQLT